MVGVLVVHIGVAGPALGALGCRLIRPQRPRHDPLELAVEHGRHDVVRILVEHGAGGGTPR